MATPFVGEIIMFAGNFAIQGWARCDGQLLPVSQNEALFSLLGTIYGGDGRTTFGLPDFRGRIPMHTGMGPGLSSRPMGHEGGQETVMLTTNELPRHSHFLGVSDTIASDRDPTGKQFAETMEPSYAGASPEYSPQMSNQGVSNAGTGSWGPHNNMQPFQCVTFLIALVGVFPSR